MAAARAIANRILKSNCTSANCGKFFSSNKLNSTIENRVLKSNCASVNSNRFFSSSKFDHQLNNGPNKNLEMQHNIEKHQIDIVKEAQRLQDDIQSLRREMNGGFAQQPREIQNRCGDGKKGISDRIANYLMVKRE